MLDDDDELDGGGQRALVTASVPSLVPMFDEGLSKSKVLVVVLTVLAVMFAARVAATSEVSNMEGAISALINLPGKPGRL